MNVKAIAAEESGNPGLAARHRGVAAKQEEAVALYMQALQAEAQGKTNQGICLNHAGIATRLSGEAQLKAIEAEESRKSELAVRYRGVAAKHEETVELQMQALHFKNQGKAKQGNYLHYAGVATRLSAEAQLKAIEAEESRKPELAARHQGIAAKHEEAVALQMQALQAEAQGKTNQGNYLNHAGIYTSCIAQVQLKAIEAGESGKLELARSYKAVVKIYQEAATLAYSALLLGDTIEARNLNDRALVRGRVAENQLNDLERS